MSNEDKTEKDKPKATNAATAEVEADETMDVTWKDKTFTVLADPDDWPVATMEAYEAGKAITFLRALLGAQFPKFQRTKPKARDAADLFAVIMAAYGARNTGE